MPDFNRQEVRIDVLKTIGSHPQFTGDQEIDDSQIDLSIRQAVNIFSKQIPRRNLQDVVGDSGKYYLLTTLLTNWEEDFSEIISIDFDSGTRIADDVAPVLLNRDDGDWEFIWFPAGQHLFLPNHSPTSSQTLTIWYTSRHIFGDDDASSSIPDQYREAVTFESVSRMLTRIAVGLEKGSDPPGGAEFPSLRSKSSGTRALADAYHDMYIQEIGGLEEVPASAQRDFDLRPIGGGEYFHHGSRVR